MELIISKNAGFCFGVTNAVEKTKDALKNIEKLYCLGELVHNGQVMDKLEKNGLIVIENIKKAPYNSQVVIRAHGVPKITYEKAKERNIELIDLTCPKVLAIHKMVEKASNDKDTYVVIIGNKNHPEIIGTKGFAGVKSIIIENEEDVEDLKEKIKSNNFKKLCVFSQTTFSMEKFHKLSNKIKEEIKSIEVEIKNCICNATEIRQTEVKELAKEVELMIIIGGKNSSNTEKLYKLSKENNENTIWIQEEKDLDLNKVKCFNKVGIATGASTSMGIVDKVKRALEN